MGIRGTSPRYYTAHSLVQITGLFFFCVLLNNTFNAYRYDDEQVPHQRNVESFLIRH